MRACAIVCNAHIRTLCIFNFFKLIFAYVCYFGTFPMGILCNFDEVLCPIYNSACFFFVLQCRTMFCWCFSCSIYVWQRNTQKKRMIQSKYIFICVDGCVCVSVKAYALSKKQLQWIYWKKCRMTTSECVKIYPHFIFIRTEQN